MNSSKIIAAILLATAAGVASAGTYSTIEASTEENRNTQADSVKYGLVVGIKAAGGMDYSIKVDASQANIGDGDISNGVEARVKKTFAGITAYDVKPYVGVRLGQKIKSDESFSHYAIDYGVKFPIIGKVVHLDLGGRYRNAFDTGHEFQSNRGHALISWDVTKQDTVGIRYSRAYGDAGEEKNAWRLSYTRSF